MRRFYLTHFTHVWSDVNTDMGISHLLLRFSFWFKLVYIICDLAGSK